MQEKKLKKNRDAKKQTKGKQTKKEKDENRSIVSLDADEYLDWND